MGEGRFIAERTLKVQLLGEESASSMATRFSSTQERGRKSVKYRAWLSLLR